MASRSEIELAQAVNGNDPAKASGAASVSHGADTYRWAIVLLCFVVMLTSFVIRIAWANAATSVGADLHLNSAMLGSFVTAFYVGYVIANTISGFFADRYGAKRVICLILVPLGLFVAGFGMIQSLVQGLVIQCCMGLMAGVNFSATSKLTAVWFASRERGRAFGILATASSISIIFANIFFPPFIAQYSWRTLYFVLGAVTILVAVMNLFLIREAPRIVAAGMAGDASPSFLSTARLFLRDRNFLLLGMAWFWALWATWGVTFWANALMVKGYGFSNVSAGQITALFGLGGLFAKPIYGLLSDLIPVPRKWMLFPCFLIFAMMLIVFGVTKTEANLRLIAPVLGAFAFIYSPLTQAMLTELTTSRNVATASGMMGGIAQMGTVFAPLVVGFLFDHTGSFLAAFAALAVGPLIAAVCIASINEPKRGR